MSFPEGKQVRLTLGAPNTERQLIDVTPVSAGLFSKYEQAFDIPESVTDLRILDIGGGASDFTAVLLNRGAEAYAIDPRYKSRSDVKGRARKELPHFRDRGDFERARQTDETIERCIKSMKNAPDHYKIAAATNLPFEDLFFDLVFSCNVLLGYLDVDLNTLVKATEEALRVTKHGGKIQLYPFALRDVGHGEGVLETRAKSLSKWRKIFEENSEIELRFEPTQRHDSRVVIVKK